MEGKNSPTTVRATEESKDTLRDLIAASDGATRVWAYRNLALLEGGYYSSDELIEIAQRIGFVIDDPFIRVRRGTIIGPGVTISAGSAIEGGQVIIGEETSLERAAISGNQIAIGRRNRISGPVLVDKLSVGDDNYIDTLTGTNSGSAEIGNNNRLIGVNMSVIGTGKILIGDYNELCSGLNLNVPFGKGTITIGHQNSLGRDGGGVISTSYRFGRRWGGDVLIGNRVETTRGAEILGFSALGLPAAFSFSDSLLEELGLIDLFVNGSLHDLSRDTFGALKGDLLEVLQSMLESCSAVSLFGTVKVKRCYIRGRTTLKDDTRVQNAYIRGVVIPERCNVIYSSFAPPEGKLMFVSLQDRAFQRVAVTSEQDWSCFPAATNSDDYPASDASYYEDYSWDQVEGKQTR